MTEKRKTSVRRASSAPSKSGVTRAASRKSSAAAGSTTRADAHAAASSAQRRGSPINLALQGGGSHGAFTWGVLNALLEDGRLEFDAITGASAGAMNAAVLADGWLDNPKDPRAGAHDALNRFWHAISLPVGLTAPGLNSAAESALSPWHALDLLTRLASPYQLNPFNANPLRDVLDEQIDFARLRSHSQIKLRICATSVRTGRPRIFTERELTTDMLLASACLPFFFQAPKIDGEAYWDGGYSGNPPLYPLHDCTMTPDILLVQINPLERPGVPDAPGEIIDRLNEISFNTSLMLEMRSIAFVQRLLDESRLDPKRYKRIYMHMVTAHQLNTFSASSKFNNAWDFLVQLRDIGHAAAHRWLTESYEDVGKRSSVDIVKTFL